MSPAQRPRRRPHITAGQHPTHTPTGHSYAKNGHVMPPIVAEHIEDAVQIASIHGQHERVLALIWEPEAQTLITACDEWVTQWAPVAPPMLVDATVRFAEDLAEAAEEADRYCERASETRYRHDVAEYWSGV